MKVIVWNFLYTYTSVFILQRDIRKEKEVNASDNDYWNIYNIYYFNPLVEKLSFHFPTCKEVKDSSKEYSEDEFLRRVDQMYKECVTYNNFKCCSAYV